MKWNNQWMVTFCTARFNVAYKIIKMVKYVLTIDNKSIMIFYMLIQIQTDWP